MEPFCKWFEKVERVGTFKWIGIGVSMVLDPVLIAILVCLALAVFCGISPILLLPKKQESDPEAEEKLRLVDERLSIAPDDGVLLLTKAELVLRSGAPNSCFEILERAYVSGVPAHTLAPTFWACYQTVSAPSTTTSEGVRNAYFWQRMMENAPTLTSHFAHSYSDADAKLEDRIASKVADLETRNLLVDAIQPRRSNLVEMSDDENLR